MSQHCLESIGTPDSINSDIRHLLTTIGNNTISNTFKDARSPLDWNNFYSLASKNRVVPLLGFYFHKKGIFPASIEAELYKKNLYNVWRNDLFLGKLKNILQLFGEARIPVILLKGAALIHTVYSKRGLRPLGDLDVFVRTEDLDRAREILSSLASETVGTLPQTPNKFVKEVTYVLDSSGAAIDLHTSITSPPHFLSQKQKDWFWNNSQDIMVGAHLAKVFLPEAQILHLCSHMVHHFGGDLLNRYDVHELIRLNIGNIEWELLISKAREFDMLIPLQKVLLELAAEWGTPIPSFVIGKLQKIVPSRREQRIFQEPYGRESSNPIRRLLNEFTSHQSVIDTIEYAWYRFFPVPSFMRKYYGAQNRFFVPFCYAYRWWIALTKR